MRSLWTTTALFALALAGTALADEASQGDIVVTATRTPTRAERLPTRVEVIDRDDIEDRSLTSLAQAIGSSAVQSGGPGSQTSVVLRGSNSKHALSLLDGIRLNDAATPNAQYDFGLDTLGGLDRVEILRGPASAIYGSDAIGGVVNQIPRLGAVEAFAPFLDLSAGSFETRQALLGAAGSADGFDYGVSADIYDSAGYDLVPARISTHTGDPDGASIHTFTATARQGFGALALDALVRVRESRVDYDTFSGGPFFDLRADADNQAESEQRVWRLGADIAASDALSFRVSGGQVLSESEDSEAGAVTSQTESTRTFADASTNLSFGETSLTAGLSFERNEIDITPQFSDPLQTEEDQSALYLIGQTRLGAIDATASVRVDDYDAFGTHTTYQIGAVSHVGPARVFVNYGTAFKAPSLSERYNTSFFNIGNPDLKPEESTSWEIGADWQLLADDALTLGGSYYQSRIDNLIEYSFGSLQNINIGEAAIDGVEVYAESEIAWFKGRVSYTWTDATNDITGAQLARRPEDAWEVLARATPLEKLSLSLSWTFVGERTDVTYDNGGNWSGNAMVPSYNVGAFAASYTLDEHADLYVRIDNLTDETYEQPAAFAGAERNGRIGVRVNF